LHQLFKNRDYKEELQTKPKDKTFLKELKNMNLHIKQLLKIKSAPEDKLNYLVKSTSPLNQNWHSSSESEVSTNSIQDQSEY